MNSKWSDKYLEYQIPYSKYSRNRDNLSDRDIFVRCDRTYCTDYGISYEWGYGHFKYSQSFPNSK
jgi:hypothetical protein